MRPARQWELGVTGNRHLNQYTIYYSPTLLRRHPMCDSSLSSLLLYIGYTGTLTPLSAVMFQET